MARRSCLFPRVRNCLGGAAEARMRNPLCSINWPTIREAVASRLTRYLMSAAFTPRGASKNMWWRRARKRPPSLVHTIICLRLSVIDRIVARPAARERLRSSAWRAPSCTKIPGLPTGNCAAVWLGLGTRKAAGVSRAALPRRVSLGFAVRGARRSTRGTGACWKGRGSAVTGQSWKAWPCGSSLVKPARVTRGFHVTIGSAPESAWSDGRTTIGNDDEMSVAQLSAGRIFSRL